MFPAMTAWTIEDEVGPIGAMGRIFHVLRQMFVDALMTPEERQLALQLQVGIEAFGRPVAAATTDEDLEFAIDEVLADPSYYAYCRTLVAPFAPRLEALAARMEGSVEPIPSVPDDVMEQLGRCAMLTRQIVNAMRPLLIQVSHPVHEELQRVERRSVLEVFYDQPLHPIEMDHGLSFYRASICQLAFSAAVLDGPISAVHLRRLAAHLERDLRKGLVLVASSPGCEVPVGLIPLHERLPLGALRARASLVRQGDHVLAAAPLSTESLPLDDAP